MADVRIGIAGVGRIGVLHARNAARLGSVALVLADADPGRARAVAREVGAEAVADADALLRSGIDGLLVATGTPAHPELVRAGVDAGVPVLCEKPLAPDVAGSRPLLEHVAARGGVVRVGHQRRFDRGYREVRRALRAGELGWVHSLRALTCDQAPPPVEFLATSGGIFRDCSVHDFDAIRWLTGREVVEVCARGSGNGDPAIREAGDVDTALALLTLDDGTLASVSASRYNGAGHDVRLEVQGSRATLVAGLDERSALRSAEAGVAFPAGPVHTTFAERFADAYLAEVAAFVDLVRGAGGEDLCTPEDAVAAAVVADAAQRSMVEGAPVRLGTA